MKQILITGVALITTAIASCTAQEATQADKTVADVEALCSLVATRYVYYSQGRADHWQEACAQAQRMAQAVKTQPETLGIFEQLLDQLYDPHATLGTNSGQSPRLVPSGADFWVTMQDERAIVEAVRPDSSAAAADIRPGDEVTAMNGTPLMEATMRRIVAGRDQIPNQRMEWAVNASLAGYRHEPRDIEIKRGTQTFIVKLEPADPPWAETPLSKVRLEGDIIHVRFNNSLGRNDTVSAFDAIVETEKDAKGWIIDLRDTPGGGGTDVAEPILGWFIAVEKEYQRIEEPGTPAYNRSVAPRDPDAPITAPVIVLAGRWTGSMGEGMTIGFDGMGRGHVMGSKMAGLAGGTEGFDLPETGVRVWLPTYNLAHLNGTPRHEWMPERPMRADYGNEVDSLLAEAVAKLKKQIAISVEE